MQFRIPNWAIWRPRPDGRPRFIWAERANSPLYGLAIGAGVPLLGLLISDTGIKWIMAAVWFGVAFPLHVFLEGRELTGQMSGRGSLDAEQTRKQVGTAQLPYWGAAVAAAVWGFGLAAHWPDYTANPLKYSIVEWAIIAHTLFVTRISNKVFYGLIMDLLKSSPRGERAEKRLPPSA